MPERAQTKVLIVEDDTVTNQLIHSTMAQAGFETLRAYSVSEALSCLGHAPDLVLLDVSLPDGDGFEVCRRVSESSYGTQVPVIFISSHDDTSTKLSGFEVGGVDYVTKPIVKAELLARVKTHLRLKQAYDMLVDLQAERIKRLSTVQESLMPRPADLPNAGFAVVLDQMNQAGGDFYDVIPVGEEMIDYLVADVSGHDLGSSLWTSAIKTLLAEYATPAHTPLDVVHAMNRVLSRILPDGVFFTLTYVRLNRRGRRMGVLVAGHPHPLLVSQNEQAQYLTAESDVVGVFADAAFQFREFKVSRGDRLYLYSDGLIELEPGADNEAARLVTLSEKVRELPLDAAVATVKQEMVNGRVPSDDILLLGIEV
jgi:sigma-B regulation protein RsbU (phosphoserine phosphatase)